MTFNFDFNFKFSFDGKPEAVSFSDFCEFVGYPRPFEKQIQMKNFMFSGTTPRMILGARGYGKTDYGTICGTASELEKDHTFEILIVTKERERGKEIVEEIRNILEKRRAKLKGRAKTKIRFAEKQGKEPNLSCLTIRSRGFRGRHPSMVILEDPITPDDTSPAERRRVKAVYEEIYKLTSNIVIIGQPVHKADLYQELREKIPTFLMVWGDIPALDVDLEAQRAAGVSEESIQASYFLRIMEAESLPFYKIETVDFWAKQNICFIDPAREGKDFTAFAIAGRNFNQWIVSGFAFRRAWYDCLEEISEMFKKIPTGRVCIETNGIGELAVSQLRSLGVPAVGRNTTTKKFNRIMNAAAYVNDIKLFEMKAGKPELIAANKAFIEQVKNFEYNVEHDDAPDALAGSLIFAGILKDV